MQLVKNHFEEDSNRAKRNCDHAELMHDASTQCNWRECRDKTKGLTKVGRERKKNKSKDTGKKFLAGSSE